MNLRVVCDAVSRVLAARRDDPRLFFLDGRDLLPDAEVSDLDGRDLLPDAEVSDLDDGLHPNAAAYERMGISFAERAFAAGTPLAAPRV